MLELTKSLCLDFAKLTVAGVVVYELLHSEDIPGSFLIPGAAVAVLLIAAAYFMQYFINKKNKKL
jgi:hypothetical protein